jgi:hypothetical protein
LTTHTDRRGGPGRPAQGTALTHRCQAAAAGGRPASKPSEAAQTVSTMLCCAPPPPPPPSPSHQSRTSPHDHPWCHPTQLPPTCSSSSLGRTSLTTPFTSCTPSLTSLRAVYSRSRESKEPSSSLASIRVICLQRRGCARAGWPGASVAGRRQRQVKCGGWGSPGAWAAGPLRAPTAAAPPASRAHAPGLFCGGHD